MKRIFSIYGHVYSLQQNCILLLGHSDVSPNEIRGKSKALLHLDVLTAIDNFLNGLKVKLMPALVLPLVVHPQRMEPHSKNLHSFVQCIPTHTYHSTDLMICVR